MNSCNTCRISSRNCYNCYGVVFLFKLTFTVKRQRLRLKEVPYVPTKPPKNV